MGDGEERHRKEENQGRGELESLRSGRQDDNQFGARDYAVPSHPNIIRVQITVVTGSTLKNVEIYSPLYNIPSSLQAS